MKLRPIEADIVRRLLAGEGTPGAAPVNVFADAAFLDRLREEAPHLGEKVFHLECRLGGDARKITAKVNKERKTLRNQLGKARLGKGEGPAKPKLIQAPTMNEYNALQKWQKGEVCDALDARIGELKGEWPRWHCGMTVRTIAGPKGKPRVVKEGGRRRAVVVTRESSVRPDEESVDAHMGGKIPVDRLVIAEVLRGDSPVWLARFAIWNPAPPDEGRVVIEVFEIADPDAAPSQLVSYT